VAIVKHANPCGVAVGDDLAAVYRDAFACDPRSAFGAIVACNQPLDEATVAAMEQAAQADVIIAPGYQAGVVDRLVAKRKNTRLLLAPPGHRSQPVELRQIGDGFLAQQAHSFATPPGDWKVVTRRQPTESQLADAEFAWRVCGHVTSNAIVLAAGGVAWGIGAGQQNRVEAGEIAASKAAGRAAGGACASDAFYPFADGIHAAADAGVSVIVQPGGSVNDDETVAAADDRDVAMIFTGERHFRH
jgi:phosphoribosylaminoimidazolecarboxamide formyltransferase/IMP cyclohydrolase